MKQCSYVRGSILGPGPYNTGLGNQLFCVAAAYAYAMRSNKLAIFPDIHDDPNVRKYGEVFYKNLNTGDGVDFRNPSHYKEKSFSYAPIPPLQGNVVLEGYFQSERYFSGCRQQLLEVLDLKNLKETATEKYGNFHDYTSIHVRRGDYLKSQYAQHHHSLALDYYRESIAHFSPESKFAVFSDDIEWCRHNFNIEKNTVFLHCDDDYEDMIMMSTCKNNIIANSTFSWWAAWMNENIDKKVIAPHKWFGPQNQMHDLSDLLPSEWTRV